ncbi:MAG: hypothetical protein ABIQ49_14720 [Gemmatimonadales bacterium]
MARLSAGSAAVLAALLAFTTLGLAGELGTFVGPDISFLLYAAGRVLDGAVLYRDVVEINPPMIIALNLPAVAAGRLLGLDVVLVYRLLTMAGLGASVLLSALVIPRAVAAGRTSERWLLAGTGFVLFLMPGIDFGQREHLLFAWILPYVFVCMGRAAGRPAGRFAALAAGALAGVAIALKPQFVLVWVALLLAVSFALGLPGAWRRQ